MAKTKEVHIMQALKHMDPADVKEFLDDNSAFVGQVTQMLKNVYKKTRIHHLAKVAVFQNMARAHGFIEVDKNFYVDRTKCERFTELLKNARLTFGPDVKELK